jgi:hypothetical protein
MTKKRLLVVLAFAAVGLAVWSLFFLCSSPKTPLRVGYDRVRQGMTAEEVHTAMKGASRLDLCFIPHDMEYYEAEADAREGSDELVVVFFANGRVAGKCFRQTSWMANWLEETRERLGF